MSDILSVLALSDSIRHILSLVCAVVYLSAFATCVVSSGKLKKISSLMWGVGTAINGLIVVSNWAVNGYMPFVSMYQVLTFLGLTYYFVYVYISRRFSSEFLRPYFILFQGVILTGVFFMGKTASAWSFPPALQSAYFIPHVLSYMISYTLVAVSALICIISFFLKGENRLRHEKAVYHLVITGFPFMVLGMFLGALWANACWGSFWSWDLKETWSLLTVMTLSSYLHLRRTEAFGKYAKVLVIFAFIFEIITLFFVGMFDESSIHSYS
ncbi:MAG: cytochrome c biogenesis protein CcsA [Clostridia bacterium]|nr:cytochrome c biogenesis protein CcsA [Clostridia bacterium]